MSKFEAGLQAARKKQIITYGALACIMVFGVMALFGTLLYSSGASIEIRPDDAQLSGSVEITSGLGFTVGGVVYSLSDQSRLQISAPGFIPVNRTLDAKEKGTVVTVTLTEKPGMIRMNTTPSLDNTKWYIDDQLVVIAAGLEQSLEPGRYRVRIDNPFHSVEEVVVDTARAELTEVITELSSVKGMLNIYTVPEGSAVTVDGADKGETPLNVTVLGGQYEIRITYPGFEPVRETLQITNQQPEITRNYRLQPLQARLSFSVQPQGGALLVNGRKIDPSATASVPVGLENVITYMHAGFYPYTEKVTLSAGEDHNISISLKPEVGLVRIESQPEASIFINNTMVGTAPLNLELPAIQTVVTLRKEGYRSVTTEITPTSKADTVVKETLQPESVARLAEAPRVYKTSVGSSMMLFQPSRFTMGAPRHEQGQRANEFVREIDLTLPFYAGVHEITAEQYKHFKPGHVTSSASNEPVTSVTWQDAARFCNWLSTKEQLDPFYIFDTSGYRGFNANSSGYRLLTEAEWEWLARRAAKEKQTMFTWGDETVIPKNAGNIADESARGGVQFYVTNYNDGNDKVAPVGSYPAEPSGLYDQTGNVSEWVHDFYSLQPPSSKQLEINPVGPQYGDIHVVKGSSWQSGTRTTLRAAYREGSPNGGQTVGFRIARYLYGGDGVE